MRLPCAHKPARLHRNEKLHRALHEKLGRRPLTLEETHVWLARWFEMYASRPQTRTHLNGQTPGEVFIAGRGPGVDLDKLTLMMLQKEIRTITKDGIRLYGRQYWNEALANRRHPVLVRYDWQLSPYTVLVYDKDGNLLCEARDRQHYQIADGIHPAAHILGTDDQKRDLSEAIEFKKQQAKEAKGGIRQMVNTIIIPEAHVRRDQDVAKPEPIKQKPRKAMSEATKAAIEAIKEQARAEGETRLYEPSLLKRWRDEAERYDYLWKAIHEHGAELVPEDSAFMEAFEGTQQFQRNYRQKYDSLLELMSFRQSQQAATA